MLLLKYATSDSEKRNKIEFITIFKSNPVSFVASKFRIKRLEHVCTLFLQLDFRKTILHKIYKLHEILVLFCIKW